MVRLDVFLRNTGLVKQRSVAREACSAGRVRVSGRTARPSAPVQPGDLLELELPGRRLQLEVLVVPERPVARQARHECYRVLGDEHYDPYADLEF